MEVPHLVVVVVVVVAVVVVKAVVKAAVKAVVVVEVDLHGAEVVSTNGNMIRPFSIEIPKSHAPFIKCMPISLQVHVHHAPNLVRNPDHEAAAAAKVHPVRRQQNEVNLDRDRNRTTIQMLIT